MKYLIIYDNRSGFAELVNVGVFEGVNQGDAIAKAKEAFNTVATLYAIRLDECQDGWCYYQ